MSFALIIEDEILIAISLEDALHELGYLTVEIATSVQQAVEAAKRQCPDLVVTNHWIRGGTGTDAVLEICSDKSLPVVFVTASAPEIRGRLPGALIVDKPFTLLTLRTAIASAIACPFRHWSTVFGPSQRIEKEPTERPFAP